MSRGADGSLIEMGPNRTQTGNIKSNISLRNIKNLREITIFWENIAQGHSLSKLLFRDDILDNLKS